MTEKDEILVVGGGLAGLSAALAMGLKGRPVRLFERSDEIGAIGYGIQIGPNVTSVFEKLGIAQQVLAKAHLPSGLLMLDAYSGEQLASVPFNDSFRRHFDGRYIAIHRVDLHNILVDACKRLPNIYFEPAVTVTGYESKGDIVRLRTDVGKTYDGAAILGADGLRSAIRAQMHPRDELRTNGYVAHRTIVPIRDVPDIVRRDEVVLWVGPAFHIIHYTLRDSSELNIVAVFKTPTFGEAQDAATHLRELQKTYRDAHPEMQAVLSLMDLSRRWPIADRDPVRGWSDGRVLLIGDSAHATFQSLAQGAGMAFEDAICLAHILEEAPEDIEAAFKRFERIRFLRTARVQLESRELWEIYHREDPVYQEIRRDQFRGRVPDDFYRCLQWLWTPVKAEPQSANV